MTKIYFNSKREQTKEIISEDIRNVIMLDFKRFLVLMFLTLSKDNSNVIQNIKQKSAPTHGHNNKTCHSTKKKTTDNFIVNIDAKM